MNGTLSADLKAQATQALQHQKAGRFAEAAQQYAAVLARDPDIWQASYNLGLVYQHLNRLPEAAEMYARAVRVQPQFAEGFNNLGNVLKALKQTATAIEAYQRALVLNANLPEASYNLATMLQARGDLAGSIEPLRQSLQVNPINSNAWDALYRGLLGLGRQEDAIQALIDWERALPQPTPAMVVAGLALCRPMGDRQREDRYLALAIAWPFAEFALEAYAAVLGMLQYFDITREDLFNCYRRYDAAISARHPNIIAPLPRRAADQRPRIGYVSADFRTHVMGRIMLEVLSRHNRSRFSILLISTCPRARHDAVTDAFKNHADGFADISELDDFAAAKSIAEADIDVLVDLAGLTMDARPGIYAHRPARTIVTHLGYHGCLGMSSVDYKFTDRIADRDDAAQFQIERPYVLDTCVFPWVRSAAVDNQPAPADDLDLAGKFVFGTFVNLLKLSPRCLAMWRQVLDALPEAVLLFSPFNPAEQLAIERLLATAGIGPERIAVLTVKQSDEAALRARYRLVHAVLDTFPYAGGDTTLAALDMGVPVVTLCGDRQSERIGASILGHLGLKELVANSDVAYVETCVRLARDTAFMMQVRDRILEAAATSVINPETHARALESAFADIASQKPAMGDMALTARQFFLTLHDAMRRRRDADDDRERRALADVFAELRRHQPEYAPLLRAQAELAQQMNDLPLAADCLAEYLKHSPGDIEARLMLAGFLIDQHAATDALMILDDIPASVASEISAVVLRTRALVQLRRWRDARETSAVAVTLAPTDVQALFWHGTVLSHVGEAESALAYLNRALILSPQHVDAAYNAGVLLFEVGHHADAEKVFRRTLGTPVEQAAHLRILQVLRATGRDADWRKEAQIFVDNFPGLERTQFIESRIARYDGNLESEAANLLPLAEHLAATPNDALAIELIPELLPFLPFHDVSPRLLRHLRVRYRDATRVHITPLSALDVSRIREVNSPIRLGYLVDFSMPYLPALIAEFLAHHDRNRFAVTVYVLSPGDLALSLTGLSHDARCVAMAANDERCIAERIRADSIELLVDMSAGGTYAKSGLLAYRPARIQVSVPGLTWAGAAGELDGRISDAVLEVDGAGDDALEPAWQLEGCALPILPRAVNEVGTSRAALGLPPEVCVFGIFAAADRISLRGLTLWKLLSERVPDATFLLAPRDCGESGVIRQMLQNAQIPAERILLLPDVRGQQYCLSGIVDVVLDALPASDYHSVVTSVQQGIPLVSMPGKMPEERVALSILTHLGDVTTIAASGRDYVDIAAMLATNPAARGDLATRLRTRWDQSTADGMPFSMTAFVRRCEQLFETKLDQTGRVPASASEVRE